MSTANIDSEMWAWQNKRDLAEKRKQQAVHNALSLQPKMEPTVSIADGIHYRVTEEIVEEGGLVIGKRYRAEQIA